MQGLHGLLYWGGGVEGVYLKEVDVARLEPGERCFDLIEQRSARQPALVDEIAGSPQSRIKHSKHRWVGRNQEEDFGHDNDFLARNFVLHSTFSAFSSILNGHVKYTDLGHKLRDEPLRVPVGVRVGRVDSSDAEVPCDFE